MKLLIDADTIAFGCAASAEDSELWVATSRADLAIENMLRATNATSYELWFTGPNNFRYQVFPEYKAGRIGAYRPKWERDVKEHMTHTWNANLTDGIEADDMMGIRTYEIDIEWIGKFDARHDIHSMISHIDKDINMIPGWHYNWELTRLGKVIREAKTYYVSPEEADRIFFTQMLVGDPTDGIKGVPGIGPKKAAAILEGLTDPNEMYKRVEDLYSCFEEMDLNGQCLWMHRKHNDYWKDWYSEEKRET
jgi:DNA polymerase-1